MAVARVVVADDDALLRQGIASLLRGAGYDVVGEAGDAGELLQRVRADQPDLVVTDIRMPPSHTWEGLDAARTIRAEQPGVGILLLSAYVEVETAVDLLRDGRSIGYLLKGRVLDAADL